jgi:hypothetical protein
MKQKTPSVTHAQKTPPVTRAKCRREVIDLPVKKVKSKK